MERADVNVHNAKRAVIVSKFFPGINDRQIVFFVGDRTFWFAKGRVESQN